MSHVDSKRRVTRRQFVVGSALVLGSTALDLSGFAQVPPSAPPAPTSAPTLSGDDLTSRGANNILLACAPVSGATSYDIQAIWGNSRHKIYQNVGASPVNLDQLSPNRSYIISYCAVNTVGKSVWSPPLKICTRLPTPPMSGLGVKSNLDTRLLIEWDVRSFLTGVDGAASVVVELGKENNLGNIVQLANNALQTSRYVDQNPGFVSTYFIRLAASQPEAPGGLNQSAWSQPLHVTHVLFPELRVPSVLESQQLALRRLLRRFR